MYPKERKEVAEIAKRNRTNPVQFYLSDDEQYILNTKFKASGMKSMSAFLRKLILYGYVYDVDYSYLRNYNTELVTKSKGKLLEKMLQNISLSALWTRSILSVVVQGL